MLLTWVLHGFADTDQLPLAMLTLLASTVAVALVGGLLPALLAAVVGFLALNYFFTPPVGTLTVSEPRNVLALRRLRRRGRRGRDRRRPASRRAAEALRARTEAATMSGLSRSVLTGQDTAEAIVERLRETFGQDAVSLLERGPAGWTVLASSGAPCAATPDEGDTRVRVDDDHVLALCGEPLRATDQRVLEAFAVQTGLVLEYRRLRERDERAANLERAEATSTALLRAVSHDLRTPLATMRAAVDGLLVRRRLRRRPARAGRARWPTPPSSSSGSSTTCSTCPGCRAGWSTRCCAPAASTRCCRWRSPATGRTSYASRSRSPRRWSAPTPACSSGWSPTWSATPSGTPRGRPVRVLAHVLPETVEVIVVDRGPGVPPEERERMFEPFQRLDDTGSGGLGLGLAVARGLTEALGRHPRRPRTPPAAG